MSDQKYTVPLPPEPRKRDGTARRVGVELEMKGLDVETLSGLVARHLQGDVKAISRYEHKVEGDAAGDWTVELDFAYLKERGREADDRGDGWLDKLDEAAEEILATGSEALVPMEVVSPPLPMDRLGDLENLIRSLRDAGARGTRDGLTFAFGMHLNPELPNTDAGTITAYLKAFLCLFDWLKAEADVDVMRRITVYIDPFPTDYVRKVVDPHYWPSQAQLIDDYLDHNPTRNRAMDMLPMFAHLDEERVRAVVDDPRIKARPTLHYRLPNCEIDEPGWGMRKAWRDWLQVELLAGNRDRLNTLCASYSEFLDQPVGRLINDWTEQVESWLADPDDL